MVLITIHRPILCGVLVRAQKGIASQARPVKVPTSEIARTPLQGASDWQPYIKSDYKKTSPRQIDAQLRNVIVDYGELTQICYDSFFGERAFDDFGMNKFPPETLIRYAPVNQKTTKVGRYQAICYLYANSGFSIPDLGFDTPLGLTAGANRLWMGYVAVSSPDSSTGLRDVVFAWRGTIAPSEWVMDVQDFQKPFDDSSEAQSEVKVANGFLKMYTKSPAGFKTPKEQVAMAMETVWGKYSDSIGSITTCGHSLGGALATICSYDLAARGLNIRPDGAAVPVTAYTYAAPRVGNEKFVDAMKKMGVKVLRMVNVRDVVPRVPGISEQDLKGVDLEQGKTEETDNGGFEYLGPFSVAGNTLKSGWVGVSKLRKDRYKDVGTVIEFDTHNFKDIMKTGAVSGAAGRNHNLEVLLHLIDPSRDLALMNKSEDALLDRDDIQPCWNEIAPFKGMYLQEDGTWRASDPYEEPDTTADPAAKQASKMEKAKKVLEGLMGRVGSGSLDPTALTEKLKDMKGYNAATAAEALKVIKAPDMKINVSETLDGISDMMKFKTPSMKAPSFKVPTWRKQPAEV